MLFEPKEHRFDTLSEAETYTLRHTCFTTRGLPWVAVRTSAGVLSGQYAVYEAVAVIVDQCAPINQVRETACQEL